MSGGSDSGPLDRRYTVRRDCAKFFAVGRVFALLFHEGLGHQSDFANPRFVSTGPKGEKIYSHIRRMAVIKQRKGYCVCVPINSYRKKGLSEKNMDAKEEQAHAIAYSNVHKFPPEPLEGEPNFDKRGIAIDLSRDEILEEASRIHFGKIYTIEWNIKVMEIGRIAGKSMADFDTYWKMELLRD